MDLFEAPGSSLCCCSFSCLAGYRRVDLRQLAISAAISGNYVTVGSWWPLSHKRMAGFMTYSQSGYSSLQPLIHLEEHENLFTQHSTAGTRPYDSEKKNTSIENKSTTPFKALERAASGDVKTTKTKHPFG